MDRSNTQPGAFGLTGAVGLQLKKPAAKKFGLQKPKPQAALAKPAGGSIFGQAALDESESVEEELARMRESKHARAAAQASHEAAIQEDASVFDYDGAFDAMQQERARARSEAVGKSSVERKAKYIGGIMEAHKDRQIEADKIYERKLVKEAEAEAHLYSDKEKFVTSAYRKKLQAREEYEAAQRAKEAQEAKEDVTKRTDMSHFYSNLLHGKVGTSAEASSSSTAAKEAAYAASFGGKAAGAAPPPEAAGEAAAGGGAGATTTPAAAGGAEAAAAPGQSAAAASTSTHDAASGGEASTGGSASAGEGDAAPPADASHERAQSHEDAGSADAGAGAGAGAGGAGESDAQLAAAIAAANAARASRPKEAAEPEAPVAVVYERRNDGEAVMSARERYLQRKKQKVGA